MSFGRPVDEFGRTVRDPNRGDFHGVIFDPRPPTSTADHDQDFEELYIPEEHILSSADKALFGIRLALAITLSSLGQ